MDYFDFQLFNEDAFLEDLDYSRYFGGERKMQQSGQLQRGTQTQQMGKTRRVGYLKDDRGVYKVAFRGVGGCAIFSEKPDYEKFLFLLDKFAKQYGSVVYGFVLMTNHAHFLVRSTCTEKLFSQVIRAYIGYYCARHKSSGKFIALPPAISEVRRVDWQVKELMYMFNNPVLANMVGKWSAYPYSSYNFYTEKGSVLSKFINVDTGLVTRNFPSFKQFRSALRKKLRSEQSLKSIK